jgi:hypothetical protein
MPKRKRLAAEKLVALAVPTRPRKWLDTLSQPDLKYLHVVARAAYNLPGISIYVLATRLKEELSAAVSINTIVRTLKELMNEKA